MTPLPSSSADPVISLQGVTKTYAIWDDPSARLGYLLRRMLGLGAGKKEQPRFTAVQLLNLEIARGECLGIIGRNGAGKSTLLQMIAGTLQPTTGTVKVRGRVAALLELGSGFNPDFTGRENIQLNAAILGLSKTEIAAKFASIVAYSGIEEFIDRPVRTYSSGMTLRLAFAVCVHVDADILIIDEALAVGDARFQFKCHATLDQLQKEGRTIIFVSHDTNSVKRMCRTALLLERGEVLLQGSPNEVTNIYTKLITSPHGVEAIRGDLAAIRQQGEAPLLAAANPAFAPDSGASSVAKSRQNVDGERLTEDGSSSLQLPVSSLPSAPSSLPPQGSLSSAPAEHLLAEERSHQQISDKEYAYGGELGRITAVQLTDAADQPRLTFPSGSAIRIRMTCAALSAIADPIYALTLKDIRGQEIFGTNTYFQNQTPPTLAAGARTQAVFDLQLNVLPGVYFISLGWVRLENSEVQVIHRRYDVLRFDVLPKDRSFGLAYCPTQIHLQPID
jgi:lipopolysaccharide transport system ATP-binding protein